MVTYDQEVSISSIAYMKAMEKDLEDRSKRVKTAKKQADQLKIKANEQMEKQEWKKAIEIYTEAIDIKRDYKVNFS